MTKFEKIGDKKVDTSKPYIELQCDWANAEEGDLNLEDGLDCPICKNKGYIMFVENGNMLCKDCTCKPTRRVIRRLKDCGVSKEMLERCKFSTYVTDTSWQKKAKEIAMEYCKDMFTNNTWLFISGVTGSGKTHLCVACFQGIIKKGKHTAEYMNWNEASTKIIALSRSFNQGDYDYYIERYKTVKLLYIDDFLKLDKNTDEALSLAFRILDYRYRNNLPTIISTELSPEQIMNMDVAIMGRINEKTANGKFIIDLGNSQDKNYRFKE